MESLYKFVELKTNIKNIKKQLKEKYKQLFNTYDINEINNLSDEIYIFESQLNNYIEDLNKLRNSSEFSKKLKLKNKYYQSSYYENVRSKGLKLKNVEMIVREYPLIGNKLNYAIIEKSGLVKIEIPTEPIEI